MYKMDSKKKPKYKSIFEWREVEYKRRVWWLIYILNINLNLNAGGSSFIQNENIFVNLPSNDDYYNNNKSTEISLILEPKQYIGYNFKKNDDEFWLIIKAFIEVGMVSNFVNRKRLNLHRINIELPTKFDYLKSRLDQFKVLYQDYFKKLKFDQNLLFPSEILSRDGMTQKYFSFLYVSILSRLSFLILHQSNIVIVSTDLQHLLNVKNSKQICIKIAIEISQLIKWSNSYFNTTHHMPEIFYAAESACTILFNALKILDHPKQVSIKLSYKDLLTQFKKFSTTFLLAKTFENRIKFKYSTHLKSITANKNNINSFPELKHSQLSKCDNNIWYIENVTSSAIYSCCIVNSNCPIHKYVFIDNWINPTAKYIKESPKDHYFDEELSNRHIESFEPRLGSNVNNKLPKFVNYYSNNQNQINQDDSAFKKNSKTNLSIADSLNRYYSNTNFNSTGSSLNSFVPQRDLLYLKRKRFFHIFRHLTPEIYNKSKTSIKQDNYSKLGFVDHIKDQNSKRDLSSSSPVVEKNIKHNISMKNGNSLINSNFTVTNTNINSSSISNTTRIFKNNSIEFISNSSINVDENGVSSSKNSYFSMTTSSSNNSGSNTNTVIPNNNAYRNTPIYDYSNVRNSNFISDTEDYNFENRNNNNNSSNDRSRSSGSGNEYNNTNNNNGGSSSSTGGSFNTYNNSNNNYNININGNVSVNINGNINGSNNSGINFFGNGTFKFKNDLEMPSNEHDETSNDHKNYRADSSSNTTSSSNNGDGSNGMDRHKNSNSNNNDDSTKNYNISGSKRSRSRKNNSNRRFDYNSRPRNYVNSEKSEFSSHSFTENNEKSSSDYSFKNVGNASDSTNKSDNHKKSKKFDLSSILN
ncbi:hypothetical protein AYI70_g3577 [Smittium culicis]|uniref:Transcription factor domain-containing protein n=1 Tax=Smittium culicis TaxID=133412 RepID=A0A1R1Y349_9FUNG|nr:hypothetical protein AYI70_g3577 [Smittium culicis]